MAQGQPDIPCWRTRLQSLLGREVAKVVKNEIAHQGSAERLAKLRGDSPAKLTETHVEDLFESMDDRKMTLDKSPRSERTCTQNPQKAPCRSKRSPLVKNSADH